MHIAKRIASTFFPTTIDNLIWCRQISQDFRVSWSLGCNVVHSSHRDYEWIPEFGSIYFLKIFFEVGNSKVLRTLLFFSNSKSYIKPWLVSLLRTSMLMVRYNKKRMKKRRSSTFRILFISNKTFFFSLFSFYMHFFNFKIQVIPSCVYLSIWIDKRKKERKKKKREKRWR